MTVISAIFMEYLNKALKKSGFGVYEFKNAKFAIIKIAGINQLFGTIFVCYRLKYIREIKHESINLHIRTGNSRTLFLFFGALHES